MKQTTPPIKAGRRCARQSTRGLVQLLSLSVAGYLLAKLSVAGSSIKLSGTTIRSRLKHRAKWVIFRLCSSLAKLSVEGQCFQHVLSSSMI
jgi:hypothetical protein